MSRSGAGLVLMYHAISDASPDPWALHVAPDRFADHLEVLCRRFAPTTLARIQSPSRGRRPAVAVTFDDGYANNLHQAAPLLERAGVPATVFVASGFVGREDESWWDALERALLDPVASLPGEIVVPLGERLESWPLDRAGRPGDEAPGADTWKAWTDPPEPRQAAYRELWERLLPLPEDARRAAVEAVLEQTRTPRAARSTHRLLSRVELRRLARLEGVEIGAHSVTHPVLAGLSPQRQREEIRRSRESLEEWTGHRVESFAYPFGQPSHLTAATTALVRDSGFARACIGTPGVVTAGTDPLLLPRLHVENCDGDEFESRLREWIRS